MLDEHCIIKIEFQSDVREINVESYDRGMFIIDSIQFYDRISLINSNAEVVFLKENPTATVVEEVEEPKKTKSRKTKVDTDTTEEDDGKNV